VNHGVEGAVRALGLSGSPTSLRPSGLVWSVVGNRVRGKWRPHPLVDLVIGKHTLV